MTKFVSFAETIFVDEGKKNSLQSSVLLLVKEFSKEAYPLLVGPKMVSKKNVRYVVLCSILPNLTSTENSVQEIVTKKPFPIMSRVRIIGIGREEFHLKIRSNESQRHILTGENQSSLETITGVKYAENEEENLRRTTFYRGQNIPSFVSI